jgi:predicted nucleotidyltransferase
MSRQSTTRQVHSRDEILRILSEEMPFLREQYGVIRLALYGSFAREEPRRESDVDLMVELSRPLGLRFVELAYYLEDKLGMRVDLATFEAFRHTNQKPHRQAMLKSITEDLTDVGTPSR